MPTKVIPFNSDLLFYANKIQTMHFAQSLLMKTEAIWKRYQKEQKSYSFVTLTMFKVCFCLFVFNLRFYI